MKTVSFAFACAGFVLALATPAHALNSHSFVSGNGSGTACTFAVPCAAIGFAVAATSSEGIVSCVDQGANSDGTGVDAVFSISKSITIDCAGVGSWYITINGSGIVVTLRNLQINMVGVSANNGIGIDFQNGAALFVEHCVIENWNTNLGAGIHFAPTSGNTELHVTDSVIKNNGIPGGGAGIFVAPTGGATVRVTVDRTAIEKNTNGIFANGTGGTVLAEVKDSMIANNATNGVWAYTSGSTSSIVLDQSVSVSNGGSGINAQGSGAFVSLDNTTVAWNATGLTTSSGGNILSYQTNKIAGNLSPGVTPISVSHQ
jgi:hypothetical protein